MRLSHLLLGGAAALLVSLPAPAQDKQKPPGAAPSTGASGSAGAGGSSAARGSVPLQENQTRQQLFGQLDANSNGSVSRAEAAASPPLTVIFIEMDTNSDGELSATEFAVVPLVNPDGTAAR